MYYDYQQTPPGFGDIFFQYAYDAGVAGLVNGDSYSGLSLDIRDYDFIVRHWGGWDTILAATGTVQLYDDIQRNLSSKPQTLASFATGEVKLPAVKYRVNSQIKFDLTNVQQQANGGNIASQLVFSGVRRVPGSAGDPAPSAYKYKRIPFKYPATLVVPSAASQTGPTILQVQVQNYDFELDRIELTPYTSPSPFSVTLYDNNNIARSNRPILANRFFNFDPSKSNGELNFWPCPPILYKTNAVINLAVTSLQTGGPTTYQLLFVGMRRIPCD